MVNRRNGFSFSSFLMMIVISCIGRAPPLAAATALPKSAGHWIVVTAPAFRDAIEPLKVRRIADGFDVTVLNTADVLSADDIIHNHGSKLVEQVRTLWKNAPESSYVLLVGAVVAPHRDDAASTQVPISGGTVGRMKNLPSDSAYGCIDGQLMPKVPVGRWPARTVDEVKGMVAKTIAFEDEGTNAQWRRSLTMLIGSPGGESGGERSMGNWLVSNLCASSSQKVNPLLRMRSIYHIASSPWYVPDDALHDESLALLRQGQAFTLHMGHSSPAGFWSDGARFLDRADWQNLNMPHGAGVLVTCGCYACRYDPAGDENQEGYGVAAIRSAGGPVAVIGATQESYSVAGYSAFNGLLHCFSTDALPGRLGQAWMEIQSGIGKGPVDFFTFTMFDYGDGSNGNIPLNLQRREHMQMWTLLGDPALRLPTIAPEIALHGPDYVEQGAELKVDGELLNEMKVDHVRVTVERPAGAAPADVAVVPQNAGSQRDAIILNNYHKAQDPVFAIQNVAVVQGRFSSQIQLPASLPWDAVVVRATSTDSGRSAMGAVKILVHR